jgi:hypothetical protein
MGIVPFKQKTVELPDDLAKIVRRRTGGLRKRMTISEEKERASLFGLSLLVWWTLTLPVLNLVCEPGRVFEWFMTVGIAIAIVAIGIAAIMWSNPETFDGAAKPTDGTKAEKDGGVHPAMLFIAIVVTLFWPPIAWTSIIRSLFAIRAAQNADPIRKGDHRGAKFLTALADVIDEWNKTVNMINRIVFMINAGQIRPGRAENEILKESEKRSEEIDELIGLAEEHCVKNVPNDIDALANDLAETSRNILELRDKGGRLASTLEAAAATPS